MKEYSKPGEREVILERKQVVLLSVFGILVLVLVFAIGVLVGKNLANLKMSKEQAQIAKQAISETMPAPAKGATAELSTTAPAIKPATGETAKIIEKIQAQQPPQLTGTAKPSSQPATPPPSSPTIKPTIPETKPVSTTPKTSPAPSLPNFAIQVAAFPDSAQAEELAKKLKANKWDAYSVPTEIPGKGTWYRVYVGRYETKALAEKGLTIFKAREPEHNDAFIRKLE